MFRLFVLLHLLFLTSYACKGGYESCQQKLIDSNSITNETIQIPVTKTKTLVYSQQKPNEKILKYDKFLELYLVESKNYFEFPFRINYFLSSGCAAISKDDAKEGEVLSPQVGLNHLAKFTQHFTTPKVLVNSCCALEGIVTQDGVIEKEYIDRFIKSDDLRYSDIGIRLDPSAKGVIVSRVNPYIKNNPFLVGDEIISFDGKSVKDGASFMRNLLFAKVGSKHKVKVKRGGKHLEFEVTTYERVGGGVLSDTFLESIGLYFSKDFELIGLSKEYEKYGLKVGDRLVKVNSEIVKNDDDLSRHLGSFQTKTALLFERNGFQFFVNIN